MVDLDPTGAITATVPQTWQAGDVLSGEFIFDPA